MTIDPEALYLQLGQLVAEMPVLDGTGPITPEINRWLGRAAHLVEATGDTIDLVSIRLASDGLTTVLRERNAQTTAAVVYRALAYAEANAPASARGAFIAVGAGFDAFQAIAKVLSEAKLDVLIVDPYMDPKVLTDFAPLAAERVAVRLLSDSHSTKPEALIPAAGRWAQQFGTMRPLEIRLSAPRALHDRLIIVDGTLVWSLTQSLKDFAIRSPALVQRVDSELAKMKVAFYLQTWGAAGRIA
jgi:hypothetical protein